MTQWKNHNSLRESDSKEERVIAKVYVEVYEDDPEEGEGNFVNSYSKTLEGRTIKGIIDKLSYRYGVSKNLIDWVYYEDNHRLSTASTVDENEIPLTSEEIEDFMNRKLDGYELMLDVVFYSNRKVALPEDIEKSCGGRIGDIVNY